jgi:small-conductance mechanosensitive channel
LLVGLLGVFSLGVTAAYVATVTMDLRQHHWAGALDASRGAVPAAVGWAALLILFFGRNATMADQLPAADEQAATQKQKQAALARDSERRAEQRVQRLAARLTELSAVAAQDAQNQQLARQIGDTAARLDLASQWLIGARAALAASQPDVTKATGAQPSHVREPGPSAGRVALLPDPPGRRRQGRPFRHDRHRSALIDAVREGRSGMTDTVLP